MSGGIGKSSPLHRARIRFAREMLKKGGLAGDKRQDAAMIHKHERKLHPGDPLTKFRAGGPVRMADGGIYRPRRYSPFAGNLASYGFGPEHRFFEEDVPVDPVPMPGPGPDGPGIGGFASQTVGSVARQGLDGGDRDPGFDGPGGAGVEPSQGPASFDDTMRGLSGNDYSLGKTVGRIGSGASLLGAPFGLGTAATAAATGIDQYNANESIRRGNAYLGPGFPDMDPLGFKDYMGAFGRNMMPDFLADALGIGPGTGVRHGERYTDAILGAPADVLAERFRNPEDYLPGETPVTDWSQYGGGSGDFDPDRGYGGQPSANQREAEDMAEGQAMRDAMERAEAQQNENNNNNNDDSNPERGPRDNGSGWGDGASGTSDTRDDEGDEWAAGGHIRGIGKFAGGGKTFDPDSDGYDYDTAISHGMKPGTDGHWESRAEFTDEEADRAKLPRGSGVMLKGRKHKTWDLGEKGEDDAGYYVKKGDDGRYYSIPKGKAYGGMAGIGRYNAGGPAGTSQMMLPQMFVSGGAATETSGGQDDDVPAMLSENEFVIPADVVSKQGDGNPRRGAKMFWDYIRNIRDDMAVKGQPPKAKGIGQYMKAGA